MTQAARALVLLLSLPLFAATSAPYLVKDLPGPITARGSLGTLWTTVGNTSFFTADNGNGRGIQIWKTDGTEAGTVQLTNSTGPHVDTFLGVVNGKILYGGADVQGDVLYSLDVTGGPPELLFREQFADPGVVYNGYLYMAANARVDGGGLRGVELWKTDGTFEGTSFADLYPGNQSSLSAHSIALAGDFIVFAGETPAGKGIYRTDGSVEGTAMLLPLSSDSDPAQTQLTPFGNRAAFVLRQPGVENNQLWVTDGTIAGTEQFVERMTAFAPGGVLDGRLLFTMKKNNRFTMWTTNGTVLGTQQLNNHSGTFQDVGIPGAVAGGKFFFFSIDPQTSLPGLYTTGALPGTTQKIIDLDALRLGGRAWNGRFYFPNRDAAHGMEWWVSDGTVAGTHMLADIAPGSRSGAISDQMLERPEGLLVGGNGPFGHEPWIIDGGARMVKNIAVDTPLPGSNPEKLRAAGHRIFFLADGPGYRVVGRSDGYDETTAEVITPTDEWWSANAFASGSRYVLHSSSLITTDGSSQGTEYLSVSAGDAVPFRGGVAFEEKTDNTSRFSSDGTVARTRIIARPGGTPATGWKVYAANNQLWYTNGSLLAVSDGTAPMRLIQPATALGAIREVVQGPDAAYFVDELFDQKRIWRTDGTNGGTQVIRILTQTPTNFIASPTTLFFTVDNVLWSSNGVNAGSLGAPGAALTCTSGTGGAPVVAGNLLYWMTRRGNGTSALWKSNGTLAGTVEVASFAASPSACTTLAALDGRVWFRAFDNDHGAELWVSDGTSAGTRLYTDLYPGTKGSDPQDLTVAGNKLFFSAETPDRGRELWAVKAITRRRAADH